MEEEAGFAAPSARERLRRLARHLPPALREALKRLPSRRREVEPPPSAAEQAFRDFVAAHAGDLRGDVLVAAGLPVASAYVLDANVRNTELTVLADLSEPGSLPPERFDCAVLTDLDDARLARALETLRPGGVLLASRAGSASDFVRRVKEA
jgi:hypothetical protein